MYSLFLLLYFKFCTIRIFVFSLLLFIFCTFYMSFVGGSLRTRIPLLTAHYNWESVHVWALFTFMLLEDKDWKLQHIRFTLTRFNQWALEVLIHRFFLHVFWLYECFVFLFGGILSLFYRLFMVSVLTTKPQRRPLAGRLCFIWTVFMLSYANQLLVRFLILIWKPIFPSNSS